VRPDDARPDDSPALLDSAEEEERGAIGENFCQPPLLPSRAVVEPPELPGLAAESAFELPRDSKLRSELWLECWIPPFALTFEPVFPGLAPPPSRPVSADLAFDAAPVVLRAEKKC
jgi:hypothetical protein